MQTKNYYLGLDIGTDSVGYAATDESYNLKRFHGENVWGSVLFDGAYTKAERRSFRTARRRLDRRQQRVKLVQELFAEEIAKVDPRFYIRIEESALYGSDAHEKFALFKDSDFTDKDYYKKYPTIHHLIDELMKSSEPHDVRLVYLACAWLVAHRGHFLSEIDKEHISELTQFGPIYQDLINTLTMQGEENEVHIPQYLLEENTISENLKKELPVTAKYQTLCNALIGKNKVSKREEGFPYGTESFLKALCGSKISAKDLFIKEEYGEISSFALGSDESVLIEVYNAVSEEDALVLQKMKAVFDWSVLANVFHGNMEESISMAKIKTYEQHKNDLKTLKHFIKKYLPEEYHRLFKESENNNYASYVYHGDTASMKKASKVDFLTELNKVAKKITPDETDQPAFEDMLNRIANGTFLPKQKDTDNRVIPYQLYWYELQQLLNQAGKYLPFLKNEDEDGLTVADKILSVFVFRIPYFVGPLNKHSEYAWLQRKAEGKIYPWNFSEKIDLDKSEDEFINRMVNQCTYLPGERVLPKNSLLYQKYAVLNEINNIQINKQPITVECKQELYQQLFMVYKKVTPKRIREYLLSNNYMGRDDEISGIDQQINAQLKTYHEFKNLLNRHALEESDVEKIVARATYTEEKPRLRNWLRKNYPELPENDIQYISKLNIKDFGRLSERFLSHLEGGRKDTGEVVTIIGELWNTNANLMQLLAKDRYTFAEEIEEIQSEYYASQSFSIEKRLEEMYISNASKRPILRTMEIVKEISKAMGGTPEKVFIEMTRGASEDQRGRRTLTRKQQILDLYQKCKDEDVRLLKQQLENMGEMADNRLQSDKLFLYYMQLGRCMYSGKTIELDRLMNDAFYNIDHIYPQALVKDDSILNNKVLVTSEANGQKKDEYPVPPQYRHQMGDFWSMLKTAGLITEEKYSRLIRSYGFSENEKWDFINRQLTETSQSTKAVAEIIKEYYPETEVVYTKARLASEFRQEFGLLKSRTYNDLHHAKDAYLNIVVGNVYNLKFTRRWFENRKDDHYSIKTKTLFTHPVYAGGKKIWEGEADLDKVKKTVKKNYAHVTKYAYCRKGGFFDQMPVKKAEGLTPLKKGMDTEKYGGYNKPTVSFFVLAKYYAGKKKELMIVPVEYMYSDAFFNNSNFAEEYISKQIRKITKKNVERIEFPIGMRMLKINTLFSLDGFVVTLAGSAGGGKCIIACPFMMFSADYETEQYIKALESLQTKIRNNSNYIYDVDHEKVCKERNIDLYNLYLSKLKESVFSKRINNPIKTIEKGLDRFIKLSVQEQTVVLLNLHNTFGRVSGGFDLTLISGSKNTGATNSFSSSLSNWKKNYSDVRIIDRSVTGLWEKQSGNLLELL